MGVGLGVDDRICGILFELPYLPWYLPLVGTLVGGSPTGPLSIQNADQPERKNEARAISELRKTCYIIGIAAG